MSDVKFTDDGSNTLTFNVDSFSEKDVDFDSYQRSTNGTLKHYTIAQKKKWTLGIKNISASDQTTLRTIYALKSALSFYRVSTDGSRTAQVRWTNNFEFLTPTKKSKQFLDKLYAGTIILEEI